MELTPGKRYRWTVEGTAVDRYDEEFPEHRIDLVYGGQVAFLTSDEASWGTLELLPDPLPTTPGSVVQLRNSIFARTNITDGYWWKRIKPYSLGDFWGDSDLEGATVLFDAGAER